MRRWVAHCLLSAACASSSFAYGGVSVTPSAGYMRGTLVTEEDFAINGPYVAFEGGYELVLGSFVPSFGAIARYSEFSYESNGLKKLAKWYYGGAFLGASVLVNDGLLWRLKLAYAPYSRFFVSSSTSLTVNEETTTIKEYSLYEGGSGTEASFSILKRYKGKNKHSPTALWGIEVGSISQPFTKRLQRSVRSNDAESVESTENVSGSYRLTMLMLGLVVGVAF